MLLFLLATSLATAQPLNYRPYGPSTPGPYAVYPPRPVAPIYASARAPIYAPAPRVAVPFDVYKANEQVYIAERYRQANLPLWTTPWSFILPQAPDALVGLPYLGLQREAEVAGLREDLIQQEIEHFRATTKQPYTLEDRNKLDDLILKRDAARGQRLRRYSQAASFTFEAGGSVAKIFERQSHAHSETLAQNELYDARKEYREEPNAENLRNLRNARDGASSASDLKVADTFDLLGGATGVSDTVASLGHVLRKKSSQKDLAAVDRNLRAARAAYHKDPSEDNWLEVRLANLAVRATEEDDNANAADLVAGYYVRSLTQLPLGIGSAILSTRGNSEKSRLWLQHARLQRQILIRSKAKAAAAAGPAAAEVSEDNVVAQRFLGLNMYGNNQPSTRINEPLTRM